MCKKATTEEDAPVTYSTSKAAEWKARQTFRLISVTRLNLLGIDMNKFDSICDEIQSMELFF